MADDDDPDGKKAQQEHARMFASTEEESRAEDRFDPVVVDLTQEDDPKKGGGKSDTGAANELRAQLQAQREATLQAQRIAMEAAQRAQIAEQRVMGSTVSAIDSALEAAQQQAANFKAELQAALDAADHKAAVDAQEKFNDARHNLMRLQEQRAYVDAEARRQPQPQPQRQQPQPQLQQPNVDQITRDLIGNGYPRSADWLRNHAEWASRPDLLKRVASASNHLVDNKGLVAETDEYFAALEQELGMQRRPNGGGDYSSVQRRPGPTASAPTSSASVSLRTGQPQIRSHVPLTPQQREFAEIHGMTEKEYAKEFEEARVAGKLIGYR
jgi:hypothetical protein